MGIEIDKIIDCFSSLKSNIHLGTLNVKTLERIEDYDLLVIISKVYKSKLYIEDDNLKSNLLSPLDIIQTIPNDEIPIIFISNETIEAINEYCTVNISSFKTSIIRKFIYKALKEQKADFKEPEIIINSSKITNNSFNKGNANIRSFYTNKNKELSIGKKSITSVVGRIEEQSTIASKILNILYTNKLLNIKASGGTGKTTLVKKVAYELYNRGYFEEGVSFKSCENVKNYNHFEEILIGGFDLMNIIDFKSHLLENYYNNKLNKLIILDNFETIINNLSKQELDKVIELLKFVTDYSNIVITSRERITSSDDFEDVYSLMQMNTDDAVILFEKLYGSISSEYELKILRHDILEDLLNNNPLAIMLITKSRTKLKHISELKEQIKEHFFESVNEDFSSVFSNDADLNIERTKSIFQSINYSYTTLNPKEKIAFELLSLFPDGISLSNFKKCFSNQKSKNKISDGELRILRDKSLVEDYNGTLQLQPIIRRFADYQFNKRTKDIKQKYSTDAYIFNCFVLDVIDHIRKTRTTSEALTFFSLYKNNLLAVLKYIPEIEISEKSTVPEKKYLLNYIYGLDDYLVSEKQIEEFDEFVEDIKDYFSDISNANTLIDVLKLNKIYYHKEFDLSYKNLSNILDNIIMEKRIFADEDYIETLYKDMISWIHSMEGHTIKYVNLHVLNNSFLTYLESHFFYLGIPDTLLRKKANFYYFEYQLMFKKLDVTKLEEYINSLNPELHLEITQTTYTLSKVKSVDQKRIQKLVVTNPYTRGLKELMFAFYTKNEEEKIKKFENALQNLFHIKYYYLEALYYYCLFLKEYNMGDFKSKVEEGLALSNQFYYQYLSYLFSNLKNSKDEEYNFNYSFYPVNNLIDYINSYKIHWNKHFNEKDIE